MNGKQCTILWHVDDLKISHTDNKVVTNIISKLSKKIAKDKPLSVTRGLMHKYLGMKIAFSNADKVMSTIYDYIKSTIEDYLRSGCREDLKR